MVSFTQRQESSTTTNHRVTVAEVGTNPRPVQTSEAANNPIPIPTAEASVGPASVSTNEASTSTAVTVAHVATGSNQVSLVDASTGAPSAVTLDACTSPNVIDTKEASTHTSYHVPAQGVTSYTRKVWNFNAGPGMLPLPVLERVNGELLDWNGSGMSVMELSHRSPEFESILDRTERDLRSLYSIPQNYSVLFLQGGATTAFASIPMNLLTSKSRRADYIVTGTWSQKAAEEAIRLYGKDAVNIAASGKNSGFKSIPDRSSWSLSGTDAAYIYLCSNETIHGVEFNNLDIEFPDGVPVVCDMSSDAASRPVDISRFAVVYFGAQKNVGPAGVVIAIVRKDLLGRAPSDIPTMLDWKVAADNKSMYNTPPTFPIYVCGLVFQWLLASGGLEGAHARNSLKAKLLYDLIDSSNGFYTAPVCVKDRSLMNIVFRIGSDDGKPGNKKLEAAFSSLAKERHLIQLEGHRSVGGMRVSLYNAMPLEGVQALLTFMAEFQKTNV